MKTENFNVKIDHFKGMINAGKYEYVNPDITKENFPLKNKPIQEKELILVSFDKPMSTEEILKELNYQGLEAADLQDLCAFGTCFSDYIIKNKSSIVALGSRLPLLEGETLIPILFFFGAWRYLHLHKASPEYKWERDLTSSHQFLAYKK